MSGLEWLVIIEVVLLMAAGVFAFISLFIARTHPDDPIVIFCRHFWLTFLYPPGDALRRGGFEVRTRGGDGGGGDSPEPRSAKRRGGGGGKVATKGDDAFYGRVKAAADGTVHTAMLNVTVLPHAETEDVLGRTSDGIELQVTCAAEDGAANKAVIQLVSKALGVKPYQVTLTKGHYATRKTVAINGMEQEQLDEKLSGIG